MYRRYKEGIISPFPVLPPIKIGCGQTLHPGPESQPESKAIASSRSPKQIFDYADVKRNGGTSNEKETEPKERQKVAGGESEEKPETCSIPRTAVTDSHSKPLKREKTEMRKSMSRMEKREKKSTRTSETLDRNTELLLRGNIYMECPSTAKIVRIFTSSTFTDTRHERNYLMENTYPRLKQFCQNVGYEFQVVDMRWGIRDEATDDHMTTELCLKEVELCNKLSTGPSFVTFLSHKYGYRDFPREIEEEEFKLLLSCVKSAETLELLNKWFVKDENSQPSTYVLQPISSRLPDFICEDEEKKKIAKDAWYKQHDQMRDALVKAAKQSLETSKAHKYLKSVTEAEIDIGLSENSERSYWFDRQINGIDKQEASYILSRYRECKGSEDYITESRELLKQLRNEKLMSKLPKNHIKTYTVDWTSNGIDPGKEASHREYIKKLATDFEEMISSAVQQAIEIGKTSSLNSPLCQEVIQHIRFCQEKCQAFYGRKETLEKISGYLKSKSDQPLVIHGQSGCGKTSIVAMAARNSWNRETENMTVIVRFLGTTPDSSNIGALLSSLINQIKLVYNEGEINPGLNLKDLTDEFQECLNLASAKRPLVVLLDSLDQLDVTANARQLFWLPKYLPDHVKIIVSTLPEAEYECFPKLQAMFTDQEFFIPVETLSNDEVGGILEKWLENKKRKLCDHQLKTILDAFHKTPLPLFLKVSFDEACRWKSYTPPETSVLKNTIRDVINDLFARIESLHGKLLVSRSLAYLTLSGGGLTETELEDILSCDDDVLNDVYMYWTPPIRRLPPLLLVRIKAELGQYFVDRGADGVRVFYWYHRQFIEAATDRYCSDDAIRQKLHAVIADYFSGVWSNGKQKSYKSKNGEENMADRYVTQQPLMLGESYNLRKLNNLPHHRQQANQLDLLKSEALCNFDFLLNKLKASGLRSVIDDFTAATEIFDDEDLRSICDALQLSQHSLQYNANELPSQLLGRLQPTKSLQPLLDACKKSPFFYLLPNISLLVQPGGSLIHCLSNHTNEVSGLDVNESGELAVTCSYDRTVKVWSIKLGRLLRSFDVEEEEPEYIKFCCSDQNVVMCCTDYMIGLNVNTGVKLYRSAVESKSNFCVAGKNKEIFARFEKKDVKLYNAQNGQWIDSVPCKYLKRKANFQEFELCSAQERYLVTTDEDNYDVIVFDVVEKRFLHKTTIYPLHKDEDGEDERDTVDALAVSPDGKYIIVSSFSSKEKYLLYDLQTMEQVKEIQGKASGDKFQFTPDGKYVYFPDSKQVLGVDMTTNETITLLNAPSNVEHCKTFNLNNVITVSNDRIVRIWDRSKGGSDSNVGKKSNTETISDSLLMENPRYVVNKCRTVNKTYNLRIYDMAVEKMIKQIKVPDNIHYKHIDGTQFLLKQKDKLALCDLETAKIIQTYKLKIPRNCVTDYLLFPNKKNFAVLSHGRNNVKIYDIMTGECEIIKGINERISSIFVNETCTMMVATIKDDEEVLFIDLVKKEVMYVYKGKMIDGSDDSTIYISNGIITADGKYLIHEHNMDAPGLSADQQGGSQPYMPIVWDIQAKKLLHALFDTEDHKKYVQRESKGEDAPDISLSDFFLLDENTIISSHDDYIVRVFDIQTGKLKYKLLGHYSNVKIILSEKGPFLVTYANWSEENSIRLWDKETFECLASYCLESEIKYPYLSSDGYHLFGIHGNEHVMFTLNGGQNLSKYQSAKQLGDHEEVFTETPSGVNLKIDELVYEKPEKDPDFDVPEPDSDDNEDDEDIKTPATKVEDDDSQGDLDLEGIDDNLEDLSDLDLSDDEPVSKK